MSVDPSTEPLESSPPDQEGGRPDGDPDQESTGGLEEVADREFDEQREADEGPSS